MIRAFLFFVFTAIVFPLAAQVFPNPATLSTGQGAIGTFDPIWTVTDFYPTLLPNPIGLTFTPALINNNCAPGAWVDPATLPPPVNNGNWITNPNLPCANNYNDGYLYFRLTLNLPSDCNGSFVTTPGAYTLYFDGYVDNAITDVFINGNSTGLSGGGFAPGSQLSITLPGPWVAGLNYVDILVYNANNGGQLNPYGLLLVANSNASATIDTDNDGLPDINDVCPCMAGTLPNGCPFPITGDTIICFGESTTLRTPYAGTYQWSTSATIDSIVVSPATNTSYSLTVTEPNGTVHTDAVTVIVHQLPTPTITPATTDVCQGENVGLTASGGQQYQWSTTDVTNIITVSPAANTTYTVTATDANGCSATANSAVTVHLPAAITVYDTICNGSTYTLPDGNSVATAGTYRDTLLTVNGCDSIIITNLTVHPTFRDSSYVTICSDQTHQLPDGSTVNTAGIYTTTPATAQGCDSVWVTQVSVLPVTYGTLYDTICTGQTYTFPSGTTVTQAGTYSDTLRRNASCDSIITIHLAVMEIGFNLTAVDVLCHGEATGSLSANITAGLQPLIYQWSDPSWSGPQITSIAAGTYSLTLTDAFGCTATQTATVAEPLPLTATVQALDVSCHGMGDGQITVVASGGTQPLSITIDTFQSGSGNLSNLGAGIYPISLVDANGCNVLDTATILEPDSFVLLTQPDSLWVDLGDTLALSLTSNHDPATAYQWQPLAGLSCLDCPNPNVLIYDTDTLVLTTSYPAPYRTGECVQEHPITINVRELKNLFVPTAFSPNADGQNDFYRVFGNLKGLRIFTMRIFDRSGELIFESNNPHFAWDGTFNGTLVGPGVFIYEVRYAWHSSWETMNTERGSLTILR